MIFSIVFSLIFALIVGGICLLNQKMSNSRKSWKQVAKDNILITSVIIIGSFFFMWCFATCISDTGYDNNEFNWDGTPKDQYRFLKKTPYDP